jgi:hypothetical protein
MIHILEQLVLILESQVQEAASLGMTAVVWTFDPALPDKKRIKSGTGFFATKGTGASWVHALEHFNLGEDTFQLFCTTRPTKLAAGQYPNDVAPWAEIQKALYPAIELPLAPAAITSPANMSTPNKDSAISEIVAYLQELFGKIARECDKREPKEVPNQTAWEAWFRAHRNWKIQVEPPFTIYDLYNRTGKKNRLIEQRGEEKMTNLRRRGLIKHFKEGKVFAQRPGDQRKLVVGVQASRSSL